MPHDLLVSRAAALFPDSPTTHTDFPTWRKAILQQFNDWWGDLHHKTRLLNAYQLAAQGASLTREPYASWWRHLCDVDLPAAQARWEERGLL